MAKRNWMHNKNERLWRRRQIAHISHTHIQTVSHWDGNTLSTNHILCLHFDGLCKESNNKNEKKNHCPPPSNPLIYLWQRAAGASRREWRKKPRVITVNAKLLALWISNERFDAVRVSHIYSWNCVEKRLSQYKEYHNIDTHTHTHAAYW